MKATELLQFIENMKTPITRLKRAAETKARADKRREDEMRRKSKLKDQPNPQNNIHPYYHTLDQRFEDGKVALS
jgi:hypothetical protein